ncbi:MAG: hypothetical protein LUD01_08510 [Clostridiales bacterium]|nr:hypothetical protein [Clostridiales bacterium]
MGEDYWDIHNHILPGVDDGSSCMEDTKLLLSAEYEQGIRNIIFTPHYRPGMFEVSADEREQVFRRVAAYAAENFPDLHLYLGCELFAHKGMLAKLSDPRYRMAGTSVILLEFSTITRFRDMYQAVSLVSEAGYRVILAHPERYFCLQKSDFRVQRIRTAGAQIQINARSILGREDRKQKHFCHTLLKENLVDFIASDAHNMESRPVEIARCVKMVRKKYGEEKAALLFGEKQQSLFGK